MCSKVKAYNILIRKLKKAKRARVSVTLQYQVKTAKHGPIVEILSAPIRPTKPRDATQSAVLLRQFIRL